MLFDGRLITDDVNCELALLLQLQGEEFHTSVTHQVRLSTDDPWIVALQKRKLKEEKF